MQQLLDLVDGGTAVAVRAGDFDEECVAVEGEGVVRAGGRGGRVGHA